MTYDLNGFESITHTHTQKHWTERKTTTTITTITITIKTVKENNEQDISHEMNVTTNVLILETAKKIQKTMTMKKKMLLCKTKKYLQIKLLLKVPERNILVTIQEHITLLITITKDWEIKNLW